MQNKFYCFVHGLHYSNKTLSSLNLIDNKNYYIFLGKKNIFFNKNYAINTSHLNIYYSNLKILKFFNWFFKNFYRTMLQLFMGNWECLIIFNELIFGAVVRLSNTKHIKHKHIFYFTFKASRPLWTIEASSNGIEIICLTNGASNEPFTSKSEIGKSTGEWKLLHLSEWNRFYTWTSDHKFFLENLVQKKIASIEIPYFIIAGNKLTAKIPHRSIAVFHHGFNKSFFGIQNIEEYFDTSKFFLERFYLDIFEVLSKYEINLIVKSKMTDLMWENKKHKFFLEKLSKNKNFILMDNSVDSYEIIINTMGTISMPTSTTAVIAKKLEKKSIYYDPYQWWLKNNPKNFSGIDIIDQKKDLIKWTEFL